MKIKFLPQNISVPASAGKSVMEMAKEQKISISSSCNGTCACAECRVYIVEGEEHVLPPTAKEVDLIGGGYFLDNRRLSCQLFCFGDVTVDLSEQVEKSQQKGGMTKQFLKKIHKEKAESVGGILVEQDEDIKQVRVSDNLEQDSDPQDNFYKVNTKKRRYKNKSSSFRNKSRRSHRHKKHKYYY